MPWIVAPFIAALPGAVYELAHRYRLQGYEPALVELKTGRAVEAVPRRKITGAEATAPTPVNIPA